MTRLMRTVASIALLLRTTAFQIYSNNNNIQTINTNRNYDDNDSDNDSNHTDSNSNGNKLHSNTKTVNDNGLTKLLNEFYVSVSQ